ncbi:unnamed protein product [Rhizophagus irregularis]|uniref:CRIB domain-containing protein n=1 Tax=Rhizophagus irregularis TaxID=588596 RepID=A0A915YQS7_9GLOM|nr:unnamed protein product [Rhizophagus irregularis]CAB4432841.1 unnamed protein product [Rhizophagus irregularis]CAB4477050.1 unnamed protein product [Rhizophagus irregularis]CAB5213480.1 unnamed protein product [Rhizophagus irregularis]CAB5315908.1 unnamed protein product [Rhizophagus irregularis]
MGGCISSSSQKQAKLDVGISSATYSQTINKKPVNNRFHENDNKIHKGLIGLPSNFQHTGHIGITELRSGKVDPEKIKNQMAEVAAALSLEGLNIGSTIPSANDTNTNNNDIKNHETPTLTSISSEQQIVTDNNNNINNNNDNNNRPISLQNESLFKVKRKPTLTPISSPVQQQRQLPSSTLNPVVDPMTEIVAALKMPIDGNFDQKLVV